MSDKDTLEKSTEKHRFQLAMLFIGGFLFIITLALAGEILGIYSGVGDLAATFGGWITAVIGFYFLQQNTERAQQQAKDATKNAASSRKDAVDAMKESKHMTKIKAELTSVGKSSLLRLRETMKELEGIIGKQRETMGKQNDFINELLLELEEMSGSGK